MIQDEHYYRQELELKIQEFLDKELVDDNPFGWVPDTLSRRMTDAAWNVIVLNKETSDFVEKELNP